MSKSEEYQQRAAECLRLAQNMADAGNRALLLEMAQAWIKLAELAENEMGAPIDQREPAGSQARRSFEKSIKENQSRAERPWPGVRRGPPRLPAAHRLSAPVLKCLVVRNGTAEAL